VKKDMGFFCLSEPLLAQDHRLYNSIAMGTIPDPLFEKAKNEAAKLQRRRLAAHDLSKEIVARREAFFDKLALLNAGALTFSATLLGKLGATTPHCPIFLQIAWGLLLIAIGACLIRNLTHQHYQMADTLTNMAESEVAYIDVDHEVVSTRNVQYSDSSEPFDKDREISLNRSNREVWKKTLDKERSKAEQHWRIVISSEWTAAISMFLGFLFLVVFATYNL
jgi:hypothetical protein